MKLQNWGPDTCGCKFTVSVENDELVFSSLIRVCDAHDGPKGQDLLTMVHAENRLKNAVGVVLEAAGIRVDLISWLYDDDRNLSVQVKSNAGGRKVRRKISQALGDLVAVE